MLPRMQRRIDEQREGEKGSKANHRPSHYFSRNFYVTTSGHFHTAPLLEAISQIGLDRVMFSVDYPYEQMDMGSRWFDDMLVDNDTKYRLGRGNANQLFGLDLPDTSVYGAAS